MIRVGLSSVYSNVQHSTQAALLVFLYNGYCVHIFYAVFCVITLSWLLVQD